MRLLLLALSLCALAAGSYWALTSGPLSPSGEGLGGFVAGLATEAGEATHAVTSAVSAAGGGTPEPAEYRGRRPVYPNLTQETYAVTGRTSDEVLESLLARGPRDGEDIFFGITETSLDVRYDPAEVGGGCMIRDARIYLQVNVKLPEWVAPAGTDPGTVSDWGRFRRALEAHEDRHRQIALDGAQRSYEAVAELYRPTCEEAIDEARRRLERIGVEVSATHRRFDANTDHGKTDGAVWPVLRDGRGGA